MSGGVGAALDEAMEALPDGEALVQGALFELDSTEIGDVEAPSPLSRALTTAAKAKPGRPAGARNRRTEAVAAWLLSQHRHPLSVMMEAYSMRPADLARRIGMKQGEDGYSNDLLLDILKLQLRMAEAVAPYVAQKMPLAVAADLKAGLTLSFEGVSLPAPGGVSGISDRDRGEAVEGMAVKLPFKSDGESRNDD